MMVEGQDYDLNYSIKIDYDMFQQCDRVSPCALPKIQSSSLVPRGPGTGDCL